MKKLVAAVLLSLVLIGSTTAARNVEHSTIPIDEPDTFPLGAEAACFGVASGTNITVHFTGEVKLTIFVDGPNAGRVHGHSRTDVTFTIPSTGASGTGRVTFTFTEKEDMLVDSNVVHITGTLPDGSKFKTNFHFHTVIKDGEVKVSLTKVNCVKP